MYSFQCRIQLQNTVQNTNRRLFQRYSAQELVHIYLRRASGTRVLCTLVQNAPCKYIVSSSAILYHSSLHLAIGWHATSVLPEEGRRRWIISSVAVVVVFRRHHHLLWYLSFPRAHAQGGYKSTDAHVIISLLGTNQQQMQTQMQPEVKVKANSTRSWPNRAQALGLSQLSADTVHQSAQW